MDIDKIQKINKLSGDLMARGMAKDRDEAMAMAESQIKNESFEGIKKQMNEQNNSCECSEEKYGKECKCEEGKSPLEKQKEEIEKFSEEENKLLKLLKDDVNMHKEKVTMLIEKMNEMINKINELEKKIRSPVSIQQKDEVKQTSFKKEAVTNNPDEVKPEHRYGEYTPGDVAIDKIFYYGNKPK